MRLRNIWSEILFGTSIILSTKNQIAHMHLDLDMNGDYGGVDYREI